MDLIEFFELISSIGLLLILYFLMKHICELEKLIKVEKEKTRIEIDIIKQKLCIISEKFDFVYTILINRTPVQEREPPRRALPKKTEEQKLAASLKRKAWWAEKKAMQQSPSQPSLPQTYHKDS